MTVIYWRRAFITFSTKFRKRLVFTGILLITAGNLAAQTSYALKSESLPSIALQPNTQRPNTQRPNTQQSGMPAVADEPLTEIYPDAAPEWHRVNDWEFSFSFSGRTQGEVNAGVNRLSFRKRLGEHSFFVNYTPGLKSSFLLNAPSTLKLEGGSPVSLNSDYEYSEPASLSYTFHPAGSLYAGINFRYINEQFRRAQAAAYFDTLNGQAVISSVEESFSDGYVSISPGIAYYSKPLHISVSLQNILRPLRSESEDEYKSFRLKTGLNAVIDARYGISNSLSLGARIGTQGIAIPSAEYSFSLFSGGRLRLFASLLHDNEQQPFISALMPSAAFDYGNLSLRLSAVKYLGLRNKEFSFTGFRENGIRNIDNNRYSRDKAVLEVSFALNTVASEPVRFLEVNVKGDIYPAFEDMYLDAPFARGRVVNLTEKFVAVKPAVMVAGLNDDWYYSPEVSVAPGDTAEVEFYSVFSIPEKTEKAKILQALFRVSAEGAQEELSSPVLLNDRHSWDGRVMNLRYFVKSDYTRMLGYSKEVLQGSRSKLDTVPALLRDFYIARILFENFFSGMIYVSDPLLSADYVQYPSETLRLKGGDCDDLSVAFASVLESVGIETAFIDYKNDAPQKHVSLMFNTHLSPENSGLLTNNDRNYYIRKNPSGEDEIWIPLETTELKSFQQAWQTGAEQFYTRAVEQFGLAKGEIEILDIY